jgi:hypothetical protein
VDNFGQIIDLHRAVRFDNAQGPSLSYNREHVTLLGVTERIQDAINLQIAWKPFDSYGVYDDRCAPNALHYNDPLFGPPWRPLGTLEVEFTASVPRGAYEMMIWLDYDNSQPGNGLIGADGKSRYEIDALNQNVVYMTWSFFAAETGVQTLRTPNLAPLLYAESTFDYQFFGNKNIVAYFKIHCRYSNLGADEQSRVISIPVEPSRIVWSY